MQTTDLIEIITQSDPADKPRFVSVSLGAVSAIIVSTVLLLLFWGIRPDFSEVITQPHVVIKHTLPALMAIPYLWLTSKARFPESSLRSTLPWSLLAIVAALTLIGVTLAPQPVDEWIPAIKGQTLIACLLSIPALALPILAALLWIIRSGASTHLALTGTIAGLTAGCLAASIYALHCYEDNPAFYAVWYSVAIASMALVGRLLGPRLLRW